MNGIVSSALCQRKQLNPGILRIVAEGPEVLLHVLVLPFLLAIGLCFESSWQSVIDT